MLNKDALAYIKTVSPYISEIVNPMLEYMGLKHFIYINLVDETSRLYLSNNENWLDCYVTHSLHEDEQHERTAIIPNKKERYALWDGYPSDNIFKACRINGMEKGFIVYDKNEIFSFAPDLDTTNNANTFLNSTEIFERFIIYFKNKNSTLLDITDRRKLLISRKKAPIECLSRDTKKISDIIRHTKLQKININTSLNIPKKYQFIRYREAQCLYYMTKGLSIKDFSCLIGVSSRSCEKYMENLRKRLGNISKNEIVHIFEENRLNKYFDVEK